MNRQNYNASRKDTTLIKLVNIGSVILFFVIAIVIYYLFINKSYSGFETFINNTSNITNVPETVYEISLKTLFKDNPRLICSMIPSNSNNICNIEGKSYIIYNFPVHMIKLTNGSILAVFNDGRLYKKDDIFNTMWQGPLVNSLPNDIVPLRMITLKPDLTTLLGVGYDNKLYMKEPDNVGVYNTVWRQVPNNSNIIYVIFDSDSGYMISIDNVGKLKIKTSNDLTSNNMELITRLDRPILRLYYDINGYMLVIDAKFDMYQFSELNWKNSLLNMQRGANSSKLQDVLYSNDGRLFGLVFNPEKYMVQIMKQDDAFYLSDFRSFENLLTKPDVQIVEFAMSDQDIIRSKTGNITEYVSNTALNDVADDDPNIAYQKQIMETRGKLKQFCATRNSTTTSNYDNYDLLANVEQNDDKIMQMKDIINNLISYEPDKERIKEKYPVINT